MMKEAVPSNSRVTFLAAALRRALSDFSVKSYAFFVASAGKTLATDTVKNDSSAGIDHWIELQYLGSFNERAGNEYHRETGAGEDAVDREGREVLHFYVAVLDGQYELLVDVSVRPSGTIEIWNEIYLVSAPDGSLDLEGADRVVGRIF